MPDITMCRGQTSHEDPRRILVCPRADHCERFTARPSMRQSFFVSIPLKGPNNCDYFMANGVQEAEDRACDCWQCPNDRHLDENGHLPHCNQEHA